MLIKWAVKWGVSPEALADLRAQMGLATVNALPGFPASQSEAAVSNNVRAVAPAYGMQLWRNNVGSLKDARGIPVRFGLANDSAKLNEVFKSSDLIGIDNEPIRAADVGQPRGRFVALETKAANWRYTGTEHERAQLAFINVVLAYGGRAQFINSVTQL